MDLSLDTLDFSACSRSPRDSMKKRRILEWDRVNFDFAFRHDEVALVSECSSQKREQVFWSFLVSYLKRK